MDLLTLETAATTSRHAVFLFGTGAGIAGCRAYYFAVRKNEGNRLHSQLAAAVLAICAAGSTGLNFHYTDQIALLKDHLAKEKDAELERFKLEKTAEIESANLRAAEANRSAEQARLELAKLKAPRVLSVKQTELFTREMSKFKGIRVSVSHVAMTSEAARLTDQLLFAFQGAGLEAGNYPPAVKGRVGQATGVVVRHVTGNQIGTRLAFSIVKLLNSYGIQATRIGSLDEEVVQRMEMQNGMSRNHVNWQWVIVGVGDKP